MDSPPENDNTLIALWLTNAVVACTGGKRGGLGGDLRYRLKRVPLDQWLELMDLNELCRECGLRTVIWDFERRAGRLSRPKQMDDEVDDPTP